MGTKAKLYSACRVDPHPFGTILKDLTAFHVDVMREPKYPLDRGVVLFWGGGDLPPMYYGRNHFETHGIPVVPDERDKFEVKLFAEAVKAGVPIIGVCRGAQLACAMSGGILIQDVNGHTAVEHGIKTTEGQVFHVPSTHHQMMYPWNTKHDLLGWAQKARSSRYRGLTDEELAEIPLDDDGDFIEPEIVWFPETKALAIQSHPEYKDVHHVFNLYLARIIYNLIVTRIS